MSWALLALCLGVSGLGFRVSEIRGTLSGSEKLRGILLCGDLFGGPAHISVLGFVVAGYPGPGKSSQSIGFSAPQEVQGYLLSCECLVGASGP